MSIDYIEEANRKKIDEFIEAYLPPSQEWTTWTHPQSKESCALSLQTAASLSAADFEACFNLIKTSLSEDYKKSGDGWRPYAKKKEMRLLDLKYLLVKREGLVQGFVSLMPTYEDNYPVVYCYEINLTPDLQGTGLANRLMELLEGVATKIPGVKKTMLTSYLSNERAVRFYRRLGYDTDEYSPLPRMLRDGTRIEPAYVIMSKPIDRN